MKKLFIIPLILTSVLLMAGCGKKAASTESVPDTASGAAEAVMNGIKVGISLPADGSRSWTREGELLDSLFRASGYETVLTYSDEAAAETTGEASGDEAGGAVTQAAAIGKMIDEGCSLIIAVPSGAASLSGAADKAENAGVWFLAADTLPYGAAGIDAYIAFDDYAVGEAEAHYLLDQLGIKESGTSKAYTLELAAGDSSDPRQGFYYNGAYDTLLPYIDGGVFRILSDEAAFAETSVTVPTPEEGSQAKVPTAADLAKERFKSILGANYSEAMSLDAVLATDDGTALAVLDAIRSSYSGKNKVLVTGAGATDQSVKSVIDGDQSMTVFFPYEQLMRIAFAVADSYLMGESPDESTVRRANFNFDVRYDTESYDGGRGIIPAYLASPVTITAANAEQVLTGSGYYESDGKYPVRKES